MSNIKFQLENGNCFSFTVSRSTDRTGISRSTCRFSGQTYFKHLKPNSSPKRVVDICRDDATVTGHQLMISSRAAVYHDLPLQNKQEQQLARVPVGHCRDRRIGFHDARRSQTIRCRLDAGVARFKPVESTRRPTRVARAMERKTLAAEKPFGQNLS